MAKDILCCFSVDFDAVSVWLGSLGAENSPADISRGVFGAELGAPRLLKLFERFGIKTTWFIPGHTVETFPRQTEMVVAAGHEIGLHGYTHENPQDLSADQEEEVMAKAVDLITGISGQKPRGYVAPMWEFSPNTIDILLRHGVTYDHSMMHDDFSAYWLRKGDRWTPIDYGKPASTWMTPMTFGAPTPIVEIPGSWHLDDMPPLIFNKRSPNSHGFVAPSAVEELWRDQFDWLYREMDYGLFIMSIHPDCSGRPHVLLMLERMFAYISGHSGTRFCTMEEIAADFRARNPVPAGD